MNSEKLFLESDYVLFSMRMIRGHIYNKIKENVGIFDYQEFWLKSKPHRIIESSRERYTEFMLLMDIKKEVDRCIVKNENEEIISEKAKNWVDKFASGE